MLNRQVMRMQDSYLREKGKKILDLYATIVPNLTHAIATTKSAMEDLLRMEGIICANPQQGEMSFQDYDKLSITIDKALAEYNVAILKTLDDMQAHITQQRRELSGVAENP
jgi:hypothetical protein